MVLEGKMGVEGRMGEGPSCLAWIEVMDGFIGMLQSRVVLTLLCSPRIYQSRHPGRSLLMAWWNWSGDICACTSYLSTTRYDKRGIDESYPSPWDRVMLHVCRRGRRFRLCLGICGPLGDPS